MSPTIEAPTINREETLRVIRGIEKSETLRSQLPSFIDEQLAFRRFAKRFAAVTNFNADGVDTASETKQELGSLCAEMIQFLTSVQASVA